MPNGFEIAEVVPVVEVGTPNILVVVVGAVVPNGVAAVGWANILLVAAC